MPGSLTRQCPIGPFFVNDAPVSLCGPDVFP